MFEPADDGTCMRWEFETLHGNNLVSRWFGLGLDHRVGGDYEKGLLQLKTLIESEQVVPAPAAPANLQADASVDSATQATDQAHAPGEGGQR